MNRFFFVLSVVLLSAFAFVACRGDDDDEASRYLRTRQYQGPGRGGLLHPAQVRALRAHCAAQGWTVAGEYVDEGISAPKESSNQRPQFRQAFTKYAVRCRPVRRRLER